MRDAIAIIGLGCRFAGSAADGVGFWRLLAEARDAVAPIPQARWNHDDWLGTEPGRTAQTTGSFLSGIDMFDGAFFGIAPREAVQMDPQQRLVLEVAWEALENAGIAPDRLRGERAGVYLGLYNDNYGLIGRGSPDSTLIDGWSASGTHTSVAPGRIAFQLGLTGPAIAIDTACSSSLTAVHLAVQALRAGDCTMALAGGVHLILSPLGLVASTKLGAASASGHCKAFDAGADGFVHGEGCGVLVLKRLADAEAAGDRVLAVIRGTAVNQDGRSAGLTAPNGPAQEAVIRAALSNAGLAPDAIDAIEAHGTGTALGDPIEMHALAAVFAGRQRPLWVGSVKTNIGHTEAAAGVAGLIKAVMDAVGGGGGGGGGPPGRSGQPAFQEAQPAYRPQGRADRGADSHAQRRIGPHRRQLLRLFRHQRARDRRTASHDRGECRSASRACTGNLRPRSCRTQPPCAPAGWTRPVFTRCRSYPSGPRRRRSCPLRPSRGRCRVGCCCGQDRSRRRDVPSTAPDVRASRSCAPAKARPMPAWLRG